MDAAIKPFRIGDVEIDFPVVLASVAGFSDLPYRLICRRLGAGYCATEMLLDQSVLAGGTLRRRFAQICDEDHPLAGQLIGNDPQVVAAAARELCQAGLDVVDLNFACPAGKVLARRRGGWLMGEPRRAVRIVRAVVAAADRPVTIKMRHSFRRADRRHSAFWQIAEGAFDAGAVAICVHGRSVEAKYTAKADWAFIASVKHRFADRTIIGSGDVLNPSEALRMLRETGVDGVAVARGALGNPWFFRQVRDLASGRLPRRPGLSRQRQLLHRHFAHACQLYGPLRGPKIMRKFGVKYAQLHPRPRDVRAAFVRVRGAEDWHAVLETFYRTS